MHDCQSQGGHFFVYKFHSHGFRCHRCTKRFTPSFSNHQLKHPWKCLIESCQYLACEQCSDIVNAELAIDKPPSCADEVSLPPGPLINNAKLRLEGREEEVIRPSRVKLMGSGRGAMESDGAGVVKSVMKNTSRPQLAPEGGSAGGRSEGAFASEKIEADDYGSDYQPYDIPVFIRTASQAAARAVLKRRSNMPRTITRGSGGEVGLK